MFELTLIVYSAIYYSTSVLQLCPAPKPDQLIGADPKAISPKGYASAKSDRIIYLLKALNSKF